MDSYAFTQFLQGCFSVTELKVCFSSANKVTPVIWVQSSDSRAEYNEAWNEFKQHSYNDKLSP